MLKPQWSYGVQCYPTAIAILAGIPAATIVKDANRKFHMRSFACTFAGTEVRERCVFDYIARKYMPSLLSPVRSFMRWQLPSYNKLPLTMPGKGLIMIERIGGRDGHTAAYSNNHVFDRDRRWKQAEWFHAVHTAGTRYTILRVR